MSNNYTTIPAMFKDVVLNNPEKNIFNYKKDNQWFSLSGKEVFYIVESISGFLDYQNQIKECHKKRKKIDNDIKESFKDLTIDKYNKKHRSDKTEKSINYITEFIFKNGDTIVTICEDWSTHMESKGYTDRLRVGIVPKKYYDWILNEAYK